MTPPVEETRRDWEVIQSNAKDKTERLKIANGYLYRVGNKHGAMAVTFVPGLDPLVATAKPAKPGK